MSNITKKVTAAATALSMLLCFSLNAVADTNLIAPPVTEISIEKMSSSLQDTIAKTNSNEKIPVMIWRTDIGHDEAETKATTSAVNATLNQNATAKTYVDNNSIASIDVLAELDETSPEYNAFIDKYIKEYRALEAAAYDEYNSDFISDYISNSDVIFSSRYSPMIIAELTANEIKNLATNNNEIEQLDIYSPEDFILDEIIVDDYVISDTHYAALETMKGSSTYFGAGSGIKIGLIDAGYPSDSGDKYDIDNITYIGTENNNPSDEDIHAHATYMAEIILSIAPDAELYCIPHNNYYTNIELLVDAGVNIINHSFSYPASSTDGTYTVRAKWMDHLATTHKVAFAKSAGNDGGTTLLKDPTMAYNAIVVGSLSSLNPITLRDNSSYEEVSGYAEKPDICAYGTATSSSTAAVTGLAALIMEKKPALKTSNKLLKAVIAAGTIKDTQTGHTYIGGIMTNECGAGCINAYKSCLAGYFNKSIGATEVTHTTSNNTIVAQKPYRISASWDAINVSDCSSSSTSSSKMNLYKVKVYQGNALLGTLQNISGRNNNLLVGEFTTFSTEQLTFKITRTSGTTTAYIGISYKRADS